MINDRMYSFQKDSFNNFWMLKDSVTNELEKIEHNTCFQITLWSTVYDAVIKRDNCQNVVIYTDNNIEVLPKAGLEVVYKEAETTSFRNAILKSALQTQKDGIDDQIIGLQALSADLAAQIAALS
jgi:hypothetical protein